MSAISIGINMTTSRNPMSGETVHEHLGPLLAVVVADLKAFEGEP